MIQFIGRGRSGDRVGKNNKRKNIEEGGIKELLLIS